ncbi:HlyD family secretion protein [Rhodoplanes sp. Z2-YC6860]|uniref:HlyD family secretion protein n=1 Tax=Rhodoplanes sp. Z2-YC6860 TaxID=674703 RepID=UPI00078CC182|nr:efflux RND transporter periplasmic adaptor subunit [Rhodoplanes sp. Z2-YC6860]AMN41702.1 efflux transporter, RND family, MFP subunit [Rhodoplanes sp. Z2-YC6860]
MNALLRNAFLLAVVGGAALTLGACSEGREPGFQGWVEADLIFVSPDEYGRVETLSVREGDVVEKGAPLFTVDPDIQQANVDMAQAALANAQVAYDRAQTLLKTAAGTQKALDDADAALRTAQAQLTSAKTRLMRRKMASPVSGSVQQIYYRPGELVPAGRPVLAMLPPGNIKVRFFVPETELARISLGQPVSVHCDGCKADVPARVTFISRTAEFTPPVIYSLDERSKLVYLIEARTDMPGELRVGQPVDVRLKEALVGEAKPEGAKP